MTVYSMDDMVNRLEIARNVLMVSKDHYGYGLLFIIILRDLFLKAILIGPMTNDGFK